MDNLEQLVAFHLPELTYERTDLARATVAAEDLARHCPLDNGRHDFHKITATLGGLDILPLEILNMIVSDLDLHTLTTFQAVNKCARLHVDRLPQYKIIFTKAPDALRAAVASGAASWISCARLSNVLCSTVCSRCPDFGAFVYLLTCERVCLLCLSYNGDFAPVPRYMARRLYGLNRAYLDRLNNITTFPATYSHSVRKREKGIVLVDRPAAFAAGIRRHGSFEKLRHFVVHRLIAISTGRHGPGVISTQITTAHTGYRTCSLYRCQKRICGVGDLL